MKSSTRNLAYASLFLAFAIVLPYFFHVTGIAGTIFLPMHIPILIAGMVLGERYGLIIGLMSPLINTFLIGMPPIFPVAIAMTFELATYGFIAGFLYHNKKFNIYFSLIVAMLCGRIVSALAYFLLLTFSGKPFILVGFLQAAFITAIWGILIQIVFIPAIVKVIEKSKIIKA